MLRQECVKINNRLAEAKTAALEAKAAALEASVSRAQTMAAAA